jgi:DNA-binding SARP family transcriptional activator
MSADGLQLRVLGWTEISGDHDAGEAVLRRPKKLALLTYLLVARPRGFQRRERLLALFWPEHQNGHARHALRQILFELRRDLGDIVDARGTNEVAVAHSNVWCDAVAFDEAIRERDLARAVSLYRGGLLDGVNLRGVSTELRDWVERERSRYRDDAARAACGLAEKAADQGDVSSAVRWARQAATLAPLDEPVLCRVLILHHSLGLRAGAETLFRMFENRLRTEFGLAPSAEMLALINSIRERHYA